MHEPPATLSCALDPFGLGDAFGMRVANTTTSANGNDLDDPLRASTGRLSDVAPNPWDRSAGWLRQLKRTRNGPQMLIAARASLPVGGYLGSLRLPFESVTPIVRLPVPRLLEAHGYWC
jgi:hypothetical protein